MGLFQNIVRYFTKIEEPPEYFKAVDTTLETEEELRKLLKESNAKVKALENILCSLATQVIDAVDTAADSLEYSGYTEEEEEEEEADEFMTVLYIIDDKPLEDFTDEEAAEYYSLS
jgi:hypothetical protein